MTRVSIKNNCKGVIKHFNKARAAGLIIMDDGSEHYINLQSEGGGSQYDKGSKVVFSLHLGDDGAKVVDLRPA